jgi:hypothetical protein
MPLSDPPVSNFQIYTIGCGLTNQGAKNMGRKGVSKRKPNQSKSKPFSNDKSGGTVSSVLSPVESRPVKSMDTGRDASSTDRKKKSRKG